MTTATERKHPAADIHASSGDTRHGGINDEHPQSTHHKKESSFSRSHPIIAMAIVSFISVILGVALSIIIENWNQHVQNDIIIQNNTIQKGIYESKESLLKVQNDIKVSEKQLSDFNSVVKDLGKRVEEVRDDALGQLKTSADENAKKLNAASSAITQDFNAKLRVDVDAFRSQSLTSLSEDIIKAREDASRVTGQMQQSRGEAEAAIKSATQKLDQIGAKTRETFDKLVAENFENRQHMSDLRLRLLEAAVFHADPSGPFAGKNRILLLTRGETTIKDIQSLPDNTVLCGLANLQPIAEKQSKRFHGDKWYRQRKFPYSYQLFSMDRTKDAPEPEMDEKCDAVITTIDEPILDSSFRNDLNSSKMKFNYNFIDTEH
ncbi:MAG: hypothetical protein HQL37_06270 [Alphaproteobacteria bacterium]|nr:hypothetical protein [Alphaproteobacteria bacterium]